MGFIEVVDLRGAIEFVEELGPADAKKHVLSDAHLMVVVVETAGDGAGVVIVVLEVGREEEHWASSEGVGWKILGFDPDFFVFDLDREFHPSVAEEMRSLSAESNGHLAILAADLIVVSIGPENSDADHVLLQVMGRAHVGSGEESETSRVNLEALIDGEFGGEISDAFRVIWIDLVGVSEFLW